MRADDPDEDLLGAVARGEAAAIQALVARKLPLVCALATRMLDDPVEAEDVAQEALLRAWRHSPRWRRGGPARFDTWLHTVVLNLCRDRLRRRRWRRERTVEAPTHPIDPTPSAQQELEMREASRQVQAALAELPVRQREAILLHHYQDLSNIEAAAVLGVSLDALESLLSRGRRALRTRLQGVQP